MYYIIIGKNFQDSRNIYCILHNINRNDFSGDIMDNNMNSNICKCRKCNGIVHEVEKGDTLYLLGKKYNVSVGRIIRENRGINPYNLIVGEKICIPVVRYSDFTGERPYDNMEQNMNRNNEESNYSEDIEEKYDMEFEEVHLASMITRETKVADIINNYDMTIGKFLDIIKNL